jgi:hypothetical protein
MGPDQREELFERAREYSTRQQTWAQAEQLWGEVVAAYRRAVHTADRVDRNDQRQLARALWRHSMLLSALNRAADGISPADEAVAIFQQVHDAVAADDPDVTSPRRDEALADLITAMADLGEIFFAAGEHQARIDAVNRALDFGLRTAGPPPTAGPRTRAAMGTAYHNLATALVYRSSSGEDIKEAALAASRAAELRQQLLDPARLISAWELTNTYVIYAHCLALLHDFDRADMVLTLGDQLLGVLGPAGMELSLKLRATAAMVARERRSPSGRRRKGRRSH